MAGRSCGLTSPDLPCFERDWNVKVSTEADEVMHPSYLTLTVLECVTFFGGNMFFGPGGV